jgi:hypothetical protein
VPVSAWIPEPKQPAAFGAVAVRDLELQQLVPCTLGRPSGPNGYEVTWFVRDLPQGASRRFRVAFTTETRPAGDSWAWVGEPESGSVELTVGQELLTRYVFEGTPKPYCYPLLGPGGIPLTRGYPMEQIEGEAQDHPHHRSLWFTHGEVRGVDFWAESDKTGREVHRAFEALEPGRVYGRLRARNDWLTAGGQKICEDVRELRVYNLSEVRLLDYAIDVTATEGPVEFGDTKEGTFGIRVAQWLVPSADNPEAHMTDSEGRRDGEVWGKAAAWCDYSGPKDGQWFGVSLFSHPTSFRHPTYWHARTYGLFAANPFGLRHFENDTTGKGRLALQAGETVSFRYRVLLHTGNVTDAKVADWYAEYADPPAVEVRER